MSRFTTVVRNCLRSAKWFGADTRVSGSFETVFRYQLKSGFPNSPRWFLGCGDWFISTLTCGPTIRTDRPKYGVGNSASFWLPLAPSLSFIGCVVFSRVTAMGTSTFCLPLSRLHSSGFKLVVSSSSLNGNPRTLDHRADAHPAPL